MDHCQGCQCDALTVVQLTLDLLIKALIHREKCPNCYGTIGDETGITTLSHAVSKIREVVEKRLNED